MATCSSRKRKHRGQITVRKLRVSFFTSASPLCVAMSSLEGMASPRCWSWGSPASKEQEDGWSLASFRTVESLTSPFQKVCVHTSCPKDLSTGTMLCWNVTFLASVMNLPVPGHHTGPTRSEALGWGTLEILPEIFFWEQIPDQCPHNNPCTPHHTILLQKGSPVVRCGPSPVMC